MTPPTTNQGRPSLPRAAVAETQIQLRVSRKRKAAYVRAAQPGTLASFCFRNLDKASNYKPHPEEQR
jgi:hypothetical protein